MLCIGRFPEGVKREWPPLAGQVLEQVAGGGEERSWRAPFRGRSARVENAPAELGQKVRVVPQHPPAQRFDRLRRVLRHVELQRQGGAIAERQARTMPRRAGDLDVPSLLLCSIGPTDDRNAVVIGIIVGSIAFSPSIFSLSESEIPSSSRTMRTVPSLQLPDGSLCG